jgi:hypothetical protein
MDVEVELEVDTESLMSDAPLAEAFWARRT